MKYGIRNRSLNMEWKDALTTAGEIGYDGVELVVREEDEIARVLTPSGRDEVLSWCNAARCGVSSLSVAPFRKYNFARADVELDKSVVFVSDCLRACTALNAAGVLFPHFERERIDLSAPEEAAFIEGFKRCAPIAEELRVYAALETSFSVEQLERIVDGVGSSYVGVYQDVANALHYGHEPVEMLTRLGERNVMIHIKDKDGEFLGEGEVPWDECVAAIKEIGYDGWLVLETRPTDHPRHAAAKNLRFIREAIGPQVSQEENREGFVPLFNGVDLSDWRVIGTGLWRVKHGVIVCDGDGRGWIRPPKEYQDFVLRLDYKTGQGGNSGVFIRTSEQGRPAFEGMEIQILDDHGEPPTKRSTGGIYAAIAPRKNMARPAGEWNAVEIVAKASQVRISMNGEVIVDVDVDDHPEKLVDENPSTPLKERLRKGYIGLQNHNSPVAFRNIRIKEIEAAE